MDEESAVGEVGTQVLNGQAADGKFAVKPAGMGASETGRGCGGQVGGATHHFVKVFCWTMTHCCSRGAMVDAPHWKQREATAGEFGVGSCESGDREAVLTADCAVNNRAAWDPVGAAM